MFASSHFEHLHFEHLAEIRALDEELTAVNLNGRDLLLTGTGAAATPAVPSSTLAQNGPGSETPTPHMSTNAACRTMRKRSIPFPFVIWKPKRKRSWHGSALPHRQSSGAVFFE